MSTCPSCQSDNIKLNGHIHNGKQNHLCKDGGRQFIINPEKKVISEYEKALLDRLLLEKISLAGMAGTLDVSQTWLGTYLSDLYACCPEHLNAHLPDQASMCAHLEDKFEEHVYQISALKKTLLKLSLGIHRRILAHLNRI